jgi:hypothetical protein
MGSDGCLRDLRVTQGSPNWAKVGQVKLIYEECELCRLSTYQDQVGPLNHYNNRCLKLIFKI